MLRLHVGGCGSFPVGWALTGYIDSFYCALPPSQRRPLARRYAQLLAPNGRLLMLKYPIGRFLRSNLQPISLTPPLL